MSMIEYVAAGDRTPALWSADDLREGSEDPDEFTDEHIGVLIHSDGQDGSGIPDGAMVYGTEAEVINYLERAIALVRREHERVYGTPLATTRAGGLTLGDPLGDDQVELLRDHALADHAAGDSDWHGGAAYAYRITGLLLRADGAVLPSGVYLRHVIGGRSWAWPVLAGDVAAYLSDIEERFVAETDR